MIGNLVLAVSSAWIAMALWPGAGTTRGVAGAFVVLSLWQLYCAASASRRVASPVVLRLGGFSWRMEDFCRGWLITGQIGTGKTVAAVNTMLWQLSKNCPTWGGVCVDDKGLYWETLAPMLRQLGREQDLILLQVRPVNAPTDWTPAHTFNFLEDPHLPYSAKAKIICDVAASLGQRTDQSFFRMQAQVQMEFAFRVLAAADYEVTLYRAYVLLTSKEVIENVTDSLAKMNTPEARVLLDHYEEAFLDAGSRSRPWPRSKPAHCRLSSSLSCRSNFAARCIRRRTSWRKNAVDCRRTLPSWCRRS